MKNLKDIIKPPPRTIQQRLLVLVEELQKHCDILLKEGATVKQSTPKGVELKIHPSLVSFVKLIKEYDPLCRKYKLPVFSDQIAASMLETYRDLPRSSFASSRRRSSPARS